MEDKSQNQNFTLGTNFFVELTQDSKQQLKQETNGIVKANSFLNDDDELLPLSGGLTFKPNK